MNASQPDALLIRGGLPLRGAVRLGPDHATSAMMPPRCSSHLQVALGAAI